MTMVLLRLGLLRKKVLLLVNSIDAGFRLRLFLETFGVRSAVLNAELPLNSRHHILQARAVRVVLFLEGFFGLGSGVVVLIQHQSIEVNVYIRVQTQALPFCAPSL